MAAHQAPQSLGFSRQEYWSGLLLPSAGDLPDPGTEPGYGCFPGGFPGGMPGYFPGEMPGMGGGMPGMPGKPRLNEILSDSEVLAAVQDPEVMVAFQDVTQNPANTSKYQSNPKVRNLISKLLAKFGGQA